MFMLDRIADLVVLSAHPGVIFVAVGVESCKSLEALLGFTVVDEPSVISLVYGQSRSRRQECIPRRLREQHNQQREHHSRNTLDPQAKTPLHRVVIRKILIRAESRPRRNKRSNAQHELLQRRNTATDRRVRNLRLVQRNNHNQEANTNARDHASSIQVFNILRCSLQRTAEEEDDGASKNGETTAEIVASRASKGSPEEGAAREDGDHGTLLGFGGIEARFEVGRCDYACDDAEVITVEDRADGGEDRDQEL